MAAKKFKVIFMPKADEQILNIMIYIAEQGYPDRAVKFSDKLYDFGNSLTIFPKKYPICKQESLARHKMRCAVFRKTYIFVYKVIDNTAVIYNIIHGKTNPENWKI